MHTEHHIRAVAGVGPKALDDQVAEMYRGVATEEPRPIPPHAHPPGETRGYPPICAHGMNSFADSGYDLALTRLRHHAGAPSSQIHAGRTGSEVA